MTFGEKIRDARLDKNLTQDQLAQLFNTQVDQRFPEKDYKEFNNDLKINGKSTISNWEKDISEPDIESIFILISILDIDANYLFEEELKREKEKLGINSNDNSQNFDEFDGVYFKFADGYTMEDLSEEDKALLRSTFNVIKKNIDKEKDG